MRKSLLALKLAAAGLLLAVVTTAATALVGFPGAWAYFKAGKAAEGLPDAERALQLSPGLAAAIDTRGHILETLGQREEAIADFRRALAIDPSIQQSKDALERLGAMAERAG